MTTITKSLMLLALFLSVQLINAQDSIPNIKNQEKIESLKEIRDKIKEEEREFLKVEVEAINVRLDNTEISKEEADKLKMKVAKKRALNIENRTAIIDHKIALLKRNEEGYKNNDDSNISQVGISISEDDDSFVGIRIKGKNKVKKYDKRTTSDFIFALGFNNAIIEDEKLDDSPYKFGGSRFFELGWAWKTRVFKNSNFLRLKYGYSLHINGLKPEGNQYFVQEGNQTMLEEFPESLRKSKLSITNLVFPVHFEFGPSKKIEKDTYFRYSTIKKLKVGVGGYAGFNMGSRQKLKYSQNGERIKDKQKRGFNTSNLVYGISAYLGIDDTAVYVKYDLSPIFKDQLVNQNNISLGIRFDLD